MNWPTTMPAKPSSRTVQLISGAEAPAVICHLKSFHPQDDHYGLSPMQAAAVALDVHNSASAWSKALLDNAARPSGAVVYRGAPVVRHLQLEGSREEIRRGTVERLLDLGCEAVLGSGD